MSVYYTFVVADVFGVALFYCFALPLLVASIHFSRLNLYCIERYCIIRENMKTKAANNAAGSNEKHSIRSE